MQKELPSEIILYNLDLSAWEASSGRIGTIQNYELVRHMSRIYYEYKHLSRKIDIQLHMHFGVLRATRQYEQLRKTIVDSILWHVSILEKLSQDILKEIDTELSKLKRNCFCGFPIFFIFYFKQAGFEIHAIVFRHQILPNRHNALESRI